MKTYTTEMPAIRGVVKSKLYEVTEHWAVKGALDDGRVFVITVEPGFVFDGASIPRWLWRICGHPYEIPRVAAALAHDWLYRAHVCSRKDADAIFRAICRQVGIGAFVAGVEYYTLRLCGRSAWNNWGEAEELAARNMGRLRWR